MVVQHKGDTALHIACRWVKGVKLLLFAGASKEIKNDKVRWIWERELLLLIWSGEWQAPSECSLICNLDVAIRMEEMVWPSSLRAHNISLQQQQEHENAVDVLRYFLFPIWSTDIHCWFSSSEQGKKPIDDIRGTKKQKAEIEQLLRGLLHSSHG